MISVGEAAPAFALPGMTAESREVEQYRLADGTADGPLMLAFYMFDFHPSCTEQLCDLHDLDWFDLDHPVTTFAISTDGVFTHREFARAEDIGVPMLSDHDGSVIEAYDVALAEVAGHAAVANRAVFVLDAGGIVRYAWEADDPTTQPPWEEVRSALGEHTEG